MTGNDRQSNHRSVRWLRAAAIALGTIAVVFLILIMAGVFDPHPVGPLAADVALGLVTVNEVGEHLEWTDSPAPESRRTDHTWQLTAAYAAGELDSGYGLALGDDERMVVVGVSPLGQAAVWEQDAAGEQSAVWLPWQSWPHVRQGADPNEVWVDVVSEGSHDQVTVRINRELLWAGQVARIGRSAGAWATTFGDPATIDFRRLKRFDADPNAGSGS